ncbi:zeta-sarcoglycan-like [Tachypleus tridentatus]|uniref:zeta-sarcoglycan-like n=1 Tax=Tachypleus tridentatus TaxID=6853 RepID=UPI003FD5C6E9
MVAADKFRVSGSGGVIFDGSIQTPLVRSESFQQLRLESPTRTLKVGAPEGVAIESRAGDITAACRKDLTLRSKEGKIWFDSEKIELKNIKIALPTTRGRTYAGIYQLCVCENGRLFLSPQRATAKLTTSCVNREIENILGSCYDSRNIVRVSLVGWKKRNIE